MTRALRPVSILSLSVSFWNTSVREDMPQRPGYSHTASLYTHILSQQEACQASGELRILLAALWLGPTIGIEDDKSSCKA